jgi:DNA-binding CsgD family transcriptional regulator
VEGIVLRQSGDILTKLEDGMFARTEAPGESVLDSGRSAADAVPQADAADQLERLVELSNQVTGVALAIIDGQFRYVGVNRPLAALNGIPTNAHVGRPIRNVVPEVGPMLTQLVAWTLQTKVPVRQVKFSARVPFVDGPMRDWLGSFFPVRLVAGAVGVAHTVIEVTDCTHIEAALSELLLDTAQSMNREALTSREVDVLTLIGQGKTTKEIATILSISVQTVGNHRKHICRKLNLHSTAEIASFAAHHGHEQFRHFLIEMPACPTAL